MILNAYSDSLNENDIDFIESEQGLKLILIKLSKVSSKMGYLRFPSGD
jgi:hypothetical protein